ncbi:ABC TRANSPORTER F FAMILY MEMBER 5 [Salix purpurea]|uniref:ABC TRANSPORTER F FAMILY MEMBER 5 n=1 Tax=Salix purpurea TaxID=77065 RepID=A0A9Q0V2V1_SALPP|nr:ABC TRANSPORTER F FAMILY MEMBER 5 [Salix purpurea]
MLEEAISEYSGTVITVSHDRYFIKQIVNRVVEVKDDKLQDYAGDYNYYLEKNLDARRRILNVRQSLRTKAPKVKAKSKMSKAEKEAQKENKKMKAFQAAKQKSKGVHHPLKSSSPLKSRLISSHLSNHPLLSARRRRRLSARRRRRLSASRRRRLSACRRRLRRRLLALASLCTPPSSLLHPSWKSCCGLFEALRPSDK